MPSQLSKDDNEKHQSKSKQTGLSVDSVTLTVTNLALAGDVLNCLACINIKHSYKNYTQKHLP